MIYLCVFGYLSVAVLYYLMYMGGMCWWVRRNPAKFPPEKLRFMNLVVFWVALFWALSPSIVLGIMLGELLCLFMDYIKPLTDSFGNFISKRIRSCASTE